MHQFRQRLFAHLRFRAAAYCILFLALVPTFFAYWRVKVHVAARDEARFHAGAEQVQKAFREQLQILTADLVAISGFFDAQTNVMQHEWDAFIARLDMPVRHPGIRSVGFTEHVNVSEAAAFVQKMRQQWMPAYQIRPAPTRPIAFPTVYVTSFVTNTDTRMGWDTYSELRRRVALDALLRTGVPVATEKLQYWHRETVQAEGFAIMVPVWSRRSSSNATSTLRGVVFSSIISQQMFDALAPTKFGSALSVELFDGTALTPIKSSGGSGRASVQRRRIRSHVAGHHARPYFPVSHCNAARVSNAF